MLEPKIAWRQEVDALRKQLAELQQERDAYVKFVEAGAIGGCPRCPCRDDGSWSPCGEGCYARLSNEVAEALADHALNQKAQEITQRVDAFWVLHGEFVKTQDALSRVTEERENAVASWKSAVEVIDAQAQEVAHLRARERQAFEAGENKS